MAGVPFGIKKKKKENQAQGPVMPWEWLKIICYVI